MTPIRIFWHILGINHYLDIVKEQMECLHESGLYDECQDITVGYLGTDEALKPLQDYLSSFDKVKFIIPHTDPNRYEFHTLRLLKNQCDIAKEKFYVVYIHTKGVSYTEERHVKSGDTWRKYMNGFLITKWRDWYKALDMKFMGYDISGVKCIPARVSPSKRTHFSGTFFAANSEYIRSLKPIDSLNISDKYEAEMWSCSGQPIIYVMCNLFIDYTCDKTFQELIDEGSVKEFSI